MLRIIHSFSTLCGMKTILGTILVLSLAQARQDQLPTEIQEQSLDLAFEAIAMIERLVATDLTTKANVEEGFSVSRPFASFHPTTIENKGDSLKRDWEDFDWQLEWKGFGPSNERRFDPMDFRIIGKK